MLLLQLLVLLFTAALWWLARRDLSARAAAPRGDLERLRDAVEALSADLEARATAAEQRIADAQARLDRHAADVERRLARGGAAETRGSLPNVTQENPAQERDGDGRYAPVYALAEAGETDLSEIARRTGLGRGEVELVLNLRARRAS